ncbi:MAG: hypothetical protein PHT41_00330 [Candidatus Omnitrophica bacterium]|nr:hypothetical protein [Candidatus Omnitrophota bacterium]MDD5238175.1 hypothetical protein [Candidatus Omnitrophota bacterium]
MKKIALALFLFLVMFNLCRAEERSNGSNYNYMSTYNSITSSAASAGRDAAMQAQNNLNAFRNTVRQQTPPSQMYQQPKFLKQNSPAFDYSQKNLTTQNLNTQLNYSQQLNKLKQDAVKHQNQGINLAVPPLLNPREFKDDPSKTVIPVDSHTQ